MLNPFLVNLTKYNIIKEQIRQLEAEYDHFSDSFLMIEDYKSELANVQSTRNFDLYNNLLTDFRQILTKIDKRLFKLDSEETNLYHELFGIK